MKADAGSYAECSLARLRKSRVRLSGKEVVGAQEKWQQQQHRSVRPLYRRLRHQCRKDGEIRCRIPTRHIDHEACHHHPSISPRYIPGRLDTFPSTWTYTNISPQLLAACGFSYSMKPGKDTCFGHVCEEVKRIQRTVTWEVWSYDDLLSRYYIRHNQQC